LRNSTVGAAASPLEPSEATFRAADAVRFPGSQADCGTGKPAGIGVSPVCAANINFVTRSVSFALENFQEIPIDLLINKCDKTRRYTQSVRLG
jgi:hypothetical protein